MGYSDLWACVKDLEKAGQLRRIDEPFDPHLQIAAIQRRAFTRKAPALLFTRPKGSAFPMLANLFGTRERLHFIFRDSIEAIQTIFKNAANPRNLLREPRSLLTALPLFTKIRPRGIRINSEKAREGTVLASQTALANLPRLVSWPLDGGAFITLPLVHTEDPVSGKANLGMYRIQISGNDYGPDEAGMHYQIHRGIGAHHARALAGGASLPVHIYVGGPPAFTLAAIMPLPEGMSELMFAGLLGNRRPELARPQGFALPVLTQCDFLLKGRIIAGLKKEGPFGDHVGYYSLCHEFPVFRAEAVYHRRNAIWPFTSVGRPPQEDTIFGDFIHELTSPLIRQVFPGVEEVNAVDAAGVHPLLLAIGSERYAPYEREPKPRELLTQAFHLLGNSQTALAKYLLITTRYGSEGLSVRDLQFFFRHLLERANFGEDLHFITRTPTDTLDYSGTALNEGSKLIWASAGEKRRDLGREIRAFPEIDPKFRNVRLVAPGILAVEGPPHEQSRGLPDPVAQQFCETLSGWEDASRFPLLTICDDADFCATNFSNFLWVAFTRSDPAADVYGVNPHTVARHWACSPPLVIDARIKSFHAPALEEDPATIRHLEASAVRGGPLEGIF